jgi:hypothetical protein
MAHGKTTGGKAASSASKNADKQIHGQGIEKCGWECTLPVESTQEDDII